MHDTSLVGLWHHWESVLLACSFGSANTPDRTVP